MFFFFLLCCKRSPKVTSEWQQYNVHQSSTNQTITKIDKKAGKTDLEQTSNVQQNSTWLTMRWRKEKRKKKKEKKDKLFRKLFSRIRPCIFASSWSFPYLTNPSRTLWRSILSVILRKSVPFFCASIPLFPLSFMEQASWRTKRVDGNVICMHMHSFPASLCKHPDSSGRSL